MYKYYVGYGNGVCAKKCKTLVEAIDAQQNLFSNFSLFIFDMSDYSSFNEA